MTNLFSKPNQFGQKPDALHFASHEVDTGQTQYDDLPADAPQGKYESPSHYLDRISRQDPNDVV